MSELQPAAPDDPNLLKKGADKYVFAFFSLAAASYSNFVLGIDPVEAGGIGSVAGTLAVSARRMTQEAVARIVPTTRRGKAARLKKSADRLFWFHILLGRLEDKGYLADPRDRVMYEEITTMADPVHAGEIEDAAVIDEVVDRNLERYRKRIGKFRPPELPGPVEP